ncbi:RDD family protein [Fulvimarina sp. 2208YS6-2-32]|uniref:RDD family protein n=1 Tax=Fulvimarina uroteuthidis TaxID=3098149 RepID=A0ABU5I2N1_9HYPH|nr:RDD family protein [Fulvimarina sp. 2208YS6-2-32]MDY8109595.1 RDD family protein [Fulvimarina sp. 2208YS6-2-32]
MDRTAPVNDVFETGSELDEPLLYRSALRRRSAAFLIDYALILILSVPAAIVVFFLGIVTLGLAFGLYAFLLPVVAIVYIAFTMGGAAQATPGMRLANLEVRRLDGGTVDPTLAVLHGVLFWASTVILTPAVVAVGLFTRRKQLLHDVLLGTVVSRKF